MTHVPLTYNQRAAPSTLVPDNNYMVRLRSTGAIILNPSLKRVGEIYIDVKNGYAL